MVHCPDCRSEVSEWAARCPVCGADLASAEPSRVPASAKVDSPPAVPTDGASVASHGVPDRRFRLIIWALAAAAAVAAVLLVVSGQHGHSIAGRRPSPSTTILPVTPTTAAAVSATTLLPPATTASTVLEPASSNALVDLTWISDTRGWALVSAPCPPSTCPAILSTTDCGRTWSTGPSVPALSQPPASQTCLLAGCFDHLRFASPTTGYLWGQSVGLFMTVDAGQTWVQQPSSEPLALEVVQGWAVRVTAPAGMANSLEVDRAPVGATGWSMTPADPGFLGANILTAAGTIYIAWPGRTAGGAPDAHTRFVRSFDGGATWKSFGDPCGQSSDGTELDALVYAATPNGDLAVLCTPRAPSGTLWITMSVDSGDHFGPLQFVPVTAQAAVQLALAENGKVALVASTGSGSVPSQVLRSTDGGRTWGSTLSAPPGAFPGTAPWFGFEDSTTGRVSFGTTSLWTTVDAGQSWIEEQIPRSF